MLLHDKAKTYFIFLLGGLALFVVTWLFFLGVGVIGVGVGLDKSDWLSFWGAFLSFIGTVFLGFVAIKQNELLHKENKELEEKRFVMEYRPIMKFIGCHVEKEASVG